MKRFISYLVSTFVALALIGTLTTCVPQYDEPGSGYGGNGRLSVSATVSEATVVTKAASVETLMEKQLNTLDVFVEHVTAGTTGDGTFLKQYHLVATTDKPILEGATAAANNWLADNWRSEGLVSGEKYNIYVAVNNPKTTESGVSTYGVTNVAALKALTYDEVTAGIAVVDPVTNNIKWPDNKDDQGHYIWASPSGNIYKQYVSEANASTVMVGGTLYGFTTEKEFMMDGVIKNWTPVSGSKDQVFGGDSNGPLNLNRAAAKFVLNVKFDADFLKSLTHNKVGGNWEPKPAAEQVTITGNPAWRFYNFAFGAPVFDPVTQGAGVEVHSSETLLRHPYAYAGDDKHFQIITYSYPNKWAAADYSTSAPSLVISVGYTEGTGSDAVTNYHYYRIPLVKNTVTAIERNHIYVINATIATKGSASMEDQDVTEDIQYAVLPWNDANNSEVIENNVQSVQHYYFRVNPKVYTLRGDGDQSVVLNYSKASGTKVNWKLFTYDTDGNQTGVVAKDAEGAVRAWFYNSDGTFTTTYSDDSGIDWSNMGVTITQSTEGTSGSKGTVTVSSTALTNKAIKYIRLRVYLDEVVEGQSLEETYHEDIIIRHFPTDNIQSIEGKWSSYHDASSSTQEVTLTTSLLSEAQSWAEQYGVNYSVSEVPKTDIITYAEYSAHSSEAEYSANIVSGVTENQMYNAADNVGEWNNIIRNANGQANAFLYDGWYYWGDNPVVAINETTTWYYSGYDYYTSRTQGRWTYYTFYEYTTRYRAQYSHTYTQTQYSVTVSMASTGNWVDWDNRDSHSPARTYTITYGNNNNGNFVAKVYDDGIYNITETESWEGYNRVYTTTKGSSYSSLTNNRMYVIQISSTSSEYVLGRPYVNQSTHQSQDNVVSPAFMIASQLGAVTVFGHADGAADAATHCDRYMEVAEDGTRYTGWRLPTSKEIKVITEYQWGSINGVNIGKDYQVLSPVLTGYYYWSLSGEAVVANDGTHGEGYGDMIQSYLRCVRDLSAEEIERLNGFDKIQEKYR